MGVVDVNVVVGVDSGIDVRVAGDVDGVTVITDIDGLLNVTVLVDVECIVNLRVVVDVDVIPCRRWSAGGVLGCGVLSVASQTGVLLLSHT